jgi:hypothetical protein
MSEDGSLRVERNCRVVVVPACVSPEMVKKQVSQFFGSICELDLRDYDKEGTSAYRLCNQLVVSHTASSPKTRALMTIIKQQTSVCENTSFVVFSYFKSALYDLAKLFIEEDTPCLVYSGDCRPEERKRVLQMFKTGKIKILLVSPSSCLGQDIVCSKPGQQLVAIIFEPELTPFSMLQLVRRLLRYVPENNQAADTGLLLNSEVVDSGVVGVGGDCLSGDSMLAEVEKEMHCNKDGVDVSQFPEFGDPSSAAIRGPKDSEEGKRPEKGRRKVVRVFRLVYACKKGQKDERQHTIETFLDARAIRNLANAKSLYSEEQVAEIANIYCCTGEDLERIRKEWIVKKADIEAHKKSKGSKKRKKETGVTKRKMRKGNASSRRED